MSKTASVFPSWFLPVLLCLLAPLTASAAPVNPHLSIDESLSFTYDPATGKRIIPNRRCLKCHGDENEKTDVRDDGSIADIFVPPDVFKNSVHGERRCNECHTKVTRVPHREAPQVDVSCIECHRDTWEAYKNDPDNPFKRLGVVIEQIEKYQNSVHARSEDEDEPTEVNADCYDCHDAHNIGTLGSIQRAEHRLENPRVCGECHRKEMNRYKKSAHGKAVMKDGNADSAVCSDCHTMHEIDSPEGDKVMLTITKNCGNCHKEAQQTYRSSYHGQVNKLGYTNTAKCFDCHGGHNVHGPDNPKSTVHKDNLLETCQQCHEDASESFTAFHPHGNSNDFEKYPFMYLTSKFMQVLVIGVLAFFWIHVLLWFYREYQDRKAGKSYDHPHPGEDTVYFRRFSTTWRWIHLFFAVSTMVLVLSGTTLLFSHTAWAPVIMDLLGGPQVEAIVHRTAATIWLGTFLVHFVIAMTNIIRKRDGFRWFGPHSMVPNMQDLRDVGEMFKWFFGKRERPQFDRYSYWQKFDYWAPFWGAAVIGFSGLMLFLPTLTATVLPGWVFNIATIVHAEEALLATMFLFTVHFFNSHFRPDRFPMSTIMFTGAVPLEEFKYEHRLEYERLQASGELEKYLVKPPSKAMETGSKALAAVLILAGLGLLTLVMVGYITMPH